MKVMLIAVLLLEFEIKNNVKKIKDKKSVSKIVDK